MASAVQADIRRLFAESARARDVFLEENADALARAVELVGDALAAERKVLLFGNGGSAADAQHIAAEFVGRFARERRALPALALTTDTSALTAIANDYGYEHVFARQLGQSSAAELLVHLGQLAGDAGAPFAAEGLGQISQRLRDPVARLVEHQRRGKPGHLPSWFSAYSA